MQKKVMTLCLIHKHPKILLGMKKRGFGVGRWNGFGGKVQDGEKIVDTAIRELKEEANIEALDLEHKGTLIFEYQNDQKIMETHVFAINEFKGDILESEEMKPEWFHTEEIPFDKMWPDDSHWLPLFLSGKKFKGHFLFDCSSDCSKIINHKLEEVEEI